MDAMIVRTAKFPTLEIRPALGATQGALWPTTLAYLAPLLRTLPLERRLVAAVKSVEANTPPPVRLFATWLVLERGQTLPGVAWLTVEPTPTQPGRVTRALRARTAATAELVRARACPPLPASFGAEVRT